jgi:hypothetical protein
MFWPTWPSSGVKICLMGKSLLPLLLMHMQVPLISVWVCNMCKFSIRIHVREVLLCVVRLFICILIVVGVSVTHLLQYSGLLYKNFEIFSPDMAGNILKIFLRDRIYIFAVTSTVFTVM